MPACPEIAPIRRRRPSTPEAWRKRATVTTNVVKPESVQPVHAGGIQSRPDSARPQPLTVGDSSRSGEGGKVALPQGGCGPASARLETSPQRIAAITARGTTRANLREKGL